MQLTLGLRIVCTEFRLTAVTIPTIKHLQTQVNGLHSNVAASSGTGVDGRAESSGGNETNYGARCQTDGRLLADRALSQLLKQDWPRSIDEL
ncbi:MAG: hypothetical protein WKF55_04245 [Gemmatimonadaceae bacterium]